MPVSGGGKVSDDRDALSNPFASELRRGPRPRIITLEEPADGEANPFPNEFPSEAPMPRRAPPALPVAKPVTRSVPPQARVPVLTEPQMPPVMIAAVRAARQVDWRNVLLGVLAFIVVVQSAFLVFRSGNAAGPPPTSGSITVTSSPSGTPVAIDGIALGVTPLSLSIAAGRHRVDVGSGPQRRGQDLNVKSGSDSVTHFDIAATAEAAPAAASNSATARRSAGRAVRDAASGQTATGWLTVASAVRMQVFENGALVGTSDMSRIALRAGTREVTLVNAGLGYRVTRTVQIAAGQVASVDLTLPMGTLSINALPWAEVWINGKRVGETPIGNLSVAIGDHDVLFRHPEFGDQRKTVTVGAQGPVRVGVDMKTPP